MTGHPPAHDEPSEDEPTSIHRSRDGRDMRRRRVGQYDIWYLGKLATILTALLASDPPELREALTRRAEANLTGLCRCGGVLEVSPTAPGTARCVMAHEPGCSATDESLRRLRRTRLGADPPR